MLWIIIIASLIVGLVSFIVILGIFRKIFEQQKLKPIISLAAGTLLGSAFLNLLPEAIDSNVVSPDALMITVLISIVVFFLLERVLHWHHCRCAEQEIPQKIHKRNLIYTNLIGDAFHNMIDGFLIAGSFLIDMRTGIVVTIAVILHEIPQEIADFGILLYGGLSRSKALLYNFLVALTAVAGAIVSYFIGTSVQGFIPYVAAFAAGNFIYLAAADLIPELHHESDPKRIVQHSLLLLVGVSLIAGMTLLFPHS